MSLLNKLLLSALCFVILIQAFANGSREKESSVAVRDYKEYKITYSKDLRTLEADVNYYMTIGWQPIAGIEVEGQTYYQALGK